MEELEKYLDDRLQLFKQSCNTWLKDQTNAYQSEHNQFLLGKIKEAEDAIDKATVMYVQMFKDSMTKLQEERELSPPTMKRFFELSEDSFKKQLDMNLGFIEKNWKVFIDNCKSQIK